MLCRYHESPIGGVNNKLETQLGAVSTNLNAKTNVVSAQLAVQNTKYHVLTWLWGSRRRFLRMYMVFVLLPWRCTNAIGCLSIALK